jgi:hypothetical protein
MEPDDEKQDAAAGTGGKGGAGGSGGPGGSGGTGGASMDAKPSSPDATAPGPDAGGGGRDAQGGSGGAGGTGGGGAGGSGGPDGATGPTTKFSFFVASMEGMRALAGNQLGFGGDLRFGEQTGLAGADKICRMLAEKGEPGAGQKTWRAFLSTSTGGPDGGPVHAIDRIGEGPWYDKMGRLFAMNKAGLTAGPRPMGDAQVVNDFPNENGIPNKMGVDNHDTLTGSNPAGRYPNDGVMTTCNDWTTAERTGRPLIGHSWPRNPGSIGSGSHWISDHRAPGCAPGYNLSNGTGMSMGGGGTVGGSGGYGGIYCFAVNR